MNGFLGSLGLTEHAEDLRDCLYRIEATLSDIREALAGDPADVTDRTQRRVFAQDTAPGSAVFNLFIGVVPPGGQWVITRWAIQTSPAQDVRLWLDTPGSGPLVAVLTIGASSGAMATDIGNSPIVTEGRQLWAQFTAPSSNAACRVDVQLDQLQDRPVRRTTAG